MELRFLRSTYSKMFALFIHPMHELQSYSSNSIIPQGKCSLYTWRWPLAFSTICKGCQDARKHVTECMVKLTFAFVWSTVKRICFCDKGSRSIQSTFCLNLAITLLLNHCLFHAIFTIFFLTYTYPKLQVAHPINDAKGFTSGNTSVNPTCIEFHEKALSHRTKSVIGKGKNHKFKYDLLQRYRTKH